MTEERKRKKTNSTKRQQTGAPTKRDKTQETRPETGRNREVTHTTRKYRDVGTGGEGAERRGQNHTRTQEQHTQRREARSREAAADRRRKGTQGPDRDSSALLDVRRGTWNINDEYLSAAAQSNAKTYHSGVEGNNTPHRARPLVPQ